MNKTGERWVRAKTWRDNLKVGDKCIVGDEVLPVARLTKTMIIFTKQNVSGESYHIRYSKSNGRKYGVSAFYTRNDWSLVEWTQEAEDKIKAVKRRKFLIDKIKYYDFNSLHLNHLEDIYRVIGGKS